MTDLRAQKKIGAASPSFQPLTRGPSAVSFTTFSMQVNAVAAQPVVPFESAFVGVRFCRGRTGHDVAQRAPERRDV
jgi:hypothetical protein